MRASPGRIAFLGAALFLTLASGPPAAPPTPTTGPPAADRAVSAAEPAAPDAPFPGARMGGGDASSEYWDFTAVFDQGHRLFARFSISNEGPGDRTAYALGQVRFPDGRIVPFQNGRLEGRWSASEDRLRVEIGSSVLDLHGPPHHFEVDKSKKGVKLFVDWESTGPGRSWGSAPDGYHLDLLALSAPARGSLWARGVVDEPVAVTGRVTLTHAFMDESEPDLLRRRIEVHGLGSDAAPVYAVHTLDVRSREASWLVAREAGGWRTDDGFGVSLAGRSDASEKGYPVAGALEIAGAGLGGRVDLGAPLLAHDPLEIAPAPFRWILSLGAEPRHVWLESGYRLEWTGPREPLRLEGTGVSSFYFLNSLDR